ncbi:MAG: ABC transporter permease [Bacteroidales bacterium]|nr:ABC transporter permease [Lentimicrobiaceae bacterium]MDD5694222.1 ABC transporter permease [Bacteroidales bacterium]
MFWNFIKTTFRSIKRDKFHTILNILGLSVGLAAFIIIYLYVRDELTYDKHNLKYRSIYRIESDFTISNKHDRFAIVPVPMGPALKLEFPEVETFVRFLNEGNTLMRYKEKEYYEDNFFFTDSTVFDVFTVEFIQGSPYKALTEPQTIVLTETTAKKYFGDINPMGEFLTSGSDHAYKVTGIIRDLPVNAHLRYDALLSAATIVKEIGAERFNSMEPVNFWNIGVYTYVLLNENASMQSIHDKFGPFYDKYMRPVGDGINGSFSLLSTPLVKTHFASGLDADLPTGNMSYVYIFSVVAIFMILIAAINYMNMATARSVKRAREVGMRKVVGAGKRELINHFLGESLLLTIIALIIAVIIVVLLLPDFNQISDKQISFNILRQPQLLIILLGIALFTGIIAGSYPSFYLSSFQPVNALKGAVSPSGKKRGGLRKGLVVFQFFIAILMIISSIVISGQLNYIQKKDLGFKKDNLVVIEMQDTSFRNKVNTFREELLQSPDIVGVTNSTGVPGRIQWIQVVLVEKEDRMVEHTLIIAQVDEDYLDVYGMELALGRNFSKESGTDMEEAVLVNETCVREMGWGENPLGKKIHWGFDIDSTGKVIDTVGRSLRVIGVVKDFHFRSLHNKVEPLMMMLRDQPRYYLTMKIKGENTRGTLEFIESKWNEFGAKRPFDYSFLSQTMDDMYTAEEKLGRLFRIATFLTIFIALLGLLGLSSYMAEQRTKEIGLRKVHGASVGQILSLQIREFSWLILIAFVLAVPFAWWRLDVWINSTFIYHDRIRWTSYLIAGLIAFAIGLITVSFHSYRAAVSNPVDAIKYE